MTKIVPWVGLTWVQIQERGFTPAIEKHLVELTALKGKDAAGEYLKFLKTGPVNHQNPPPK